MEARVAHAASRGWHPSFPRHSPCEAHPRSCCGPSSAVGPFSYPCRASASWSSLWSAWSACSREIRAFWSASWTSLHQVESPINGKPRGSTHQPPDPVNGNAPSSLSLAESSEELSDPLLSPPPASSTRRCLRSCQIKKSQRWFQLHQTVGFCLSFKSPLFPPKTCLFKGSDLLAMDR